MLNLLNTFAVIMNKHKSLNNNLKEVEGVKQPPKISTNAVKKHQLAKRTTPSEEEFVKNILAGNITYLSRAITLIESKNPTHKKKATSIIDQCLPFANKSIRIGITGIPGVGKSTFIEAFGKYYTSKSHKVAVLAIDPTSSINKGSILGDKTRMEELVKDPNAFIRPTPSGDSLGGVAQKTRETIILCEAAGFDIIFIETVGVGQGEIAVHSMVDFFLLLQIAGAGDELQGIKRGIIEMADAIVINKADNENVKNAELAKNEIKSALHLYPTKDNGWQPIVTVCSAFYKTGIAEIYELISNFFNTTKKNGYFEKRRAEQNNYWLLETINQQLKSEFYAKKSVQSALKKYAKEMKNLKTTPFKAAEELLKLAKK